MRPAKFKFLPALLLLGVVASASAQTPSSIDFKVSGSPNYPILNTGTGSLINYDLKNDRINFSVGSTGAYDNPFFCFDFSDAEGAAVTLRATDANGHRVMDSVGLASDLAYDLANDVISTSPSSSVQCFFKSSGGTFGPFGNEATGSRDSGLGLRSCSDPDVGPEDDCSFHHDEFAAYPSLELYFENFHVVDDNGALVSLGDNLAVSAGDELVYEIILRNTGDGAADSIALQEVFPSSAVFSAGLTEGGWACADNWDNMLCPDDGLGALRFKGIELPAGGQLTFTISREVQLDSTGQIHLYAGAVNGPGKTESAVHEEVIDVVGEATAMVFANKPRTTVLGEPIRAENGDAIEVWVIDDNGNLVSNHNSGQIRMELFDGVGFLAELQGYTGVVNGVAVFADLSTTGLDLSAGTDYELRAVPTESFGNVYSQTFEITLQ